MNQLPSGKLWKLCFFLQLGVIALITLKSVFGDIGGHYMIFTTAGSELLHGRNPYGVDWNYGGLWFYSPICGWFFGLLSLLPSKVGLVAFNCGSHLILVEGFRRFLRLFPRIPQENAFLSSLIILSTGELIGAYQSVKLEMAMIGVMLIVADQISRRPVHAAVWGAMLINFKWFPLAPIGLLAVSNLRQGKYKFSLLLPVFLMVWFVLPVLFYGWQFTLELYRVQNSTLDQFVSQVFNDFPSVFGMLKHTFGISLLNSAVSTIMGTAAFLLAGLIWFAPYEKDSQRLLAMSFGTLYVVNFNLLSQFNAYVIATPALAYILFLAFASQGWRRYLSVFSVSAYWIIVSMFFSDLVPHSFRDLCRELRIKPLGSLVVLVVLMGFVLCDILRKWVKDIPNCQSVAKA